MVRLFGERVILREWAEADLEAMHAWLGDPAVMRFLSWGSESRDETREHLELCLREQARADRERFYLAVELRGAGEVIGGAGTEYRSRKYDGGEGGLGYFLRPTYWGRGYATEAARLVLGFAFEQLGMHKVSASCDAGNRASERVMQKCGMTLEGRLRESHQRFGEWRDRLLYGILRREWKDPTGT